MGNRKRWLAVGVLSPLALAAIVNGESYTYDLPQTNFFENRDGSSITLAQWAVPAGQVCLITLTTDNTDPNRNSTHPGNALAIDGVVVQSRVEADQQAHTWGPFTIVSDGQVDITAELGFDPNFGQGVWSQASTGYAECNVPPTTTQETVPSTTTSIPTSSTEQPSTTQPESTTTTSSLNVTTTTVVGSTSSSSPETTQASSTVPSSSHPETSSSSLSTTSTTPQVSHQGTLPATGPKETASKGGWTALVVILFGIFLAMTGTRRKNW